MGASKLRATLDVEDAPEKGRSFARVALNGQSGGLRIALKADATGDHANIMQAVARVDATIETDDSAQMFRLIGLDRAATTAKGPGKFTLNAQGPLDGAIKLDSRVTAESLDGRVQGTMRLSNDDERQRAIRSRHHQCRSRLAAHASPGERIDARRSRHASP